MTHDGQYERPFDAVRRALGNAAASDYDVVVSDDLHLDPTRDRRTGAPEFVLASHKPADQVVRALGLLVERSGRALATRCSAETVEAVEFAFAASYSVERFSVSRIVVVADREAPAPVTGGKVGVISAGATDAAVAEEAAVIARELGCTVMRVDDVGVAGLHRLIRPLEQLVEAGVDAIVVAAGMDGALPSVVTGLVSVPVIGVPVSTGYGFGGEGLGALMAMLQSCAPGLTVVNIDNGVGAGVAAARIANHAAARRAGA